MQEPNARSVQGSDADRAEGGLDVENSFAELDAATSARLSREAEAVGRAHQHAGGGAGAGADGRHIGGRSAMEMLTTPVEGDADMTGEVQ